MRTLESKDPGEYQIKKIELNDGTILEVDKIVHISVVKRKQTGDHYDFTISYTAASRDDLLALSNECNMLAHAFKFMREYNISFDEACKMYDDYLEVARGKIK